MEYTKNYHLPQWVETDRIMMQDFNAAMADIESGLTACRSGTEQAADALTAQGQALAAQIAAARQEAANADSANLARSKSDLQRGLFRLAYNQCAHLLELEETPALDGIFLQRLDRGEIPSNSTGMELHQDGVWCASSGPGGTIEAIQDGMEEIAMLELVKDKLSSCKKAVYTFAPTGAVCIHRMTMSGGFGDNDKSEGRVLITLDNLTRGIREVERESGNGAEGLTRGGSLKVAPYAYMHGGDKYRLEIIPLTATLTGTFYHGKGVQMTLEYFDLSTNNFSATLFHKFGAEETGHGGLILVRYDAYDKGGSMTASWGGAEQQPQRVRSFTDRQGRAIKEAEFRFAHPIPGGSTATLKATVPSGGDVILYNWCAALL